MSTVLISGANRGIGLAFARQYAADGWRLIAGVRDPDGAHALREIEGVTVHPLDVDDDSSVAAFRQAVGDEPIDILIANAGVFGESQAIGRFDFADWLHTFSVNSLGPLRLAEALLPNVRAGRDKKLVAITSQLGSSSNHAGDMLAYRASKAALNNVWAGMAAARPEFIWLPLHPGWVKTDMGGAGADLSPEESARGLRTQIAQSGPERSGKPFTYAGAPLPW